MRLFFSIAILGLTFSLSAQNTNCFEFVYPLMFELSDGSTVEVDNHRYMTKYKSSWKNKGESPNLKFPIEVKWTGRDVMVVESQEMLDRHWARCEKSKTASKKCFQLIYPIYFSIDGERIQIGSKSEMESYKKEWSGKNLSSEMLYPIEIQWEGLQPINVNSTEEMRSWRMKCR